MFQPVTPVLGPEIIVKVTLTPDTGFPAVSNTVAVRVWLVLTGFVADRGAKDRTLTQVFVTVFEVTAAFCSLTKLAVISSVPGEPFDV
jgi:hypothetical protein